MADQKTLLNTRLSLRIDTWEKWQDESVAGQGANLKLNAGEVAFVQVTSVPPEATEKYNLDTVLFKVGDGSKTFKELPWGSALAADVYGWAKKTDVDFCKWLSGDNELTQAVTFVTNSSFESAVSELEAEDLSLGNRIAVLESMAGIGDGEGDNQDGLATVAYVDGKVEAEKDEREAADAALLGTLDAEGNAVAGNTILSAKADAAAAATLAAQAKTIADTKVTAVEGKGLSEADFTTAEKTKLAGIAEGANKTIVDAALDKDSTNPVENKAVKAAIDAVSAVADAAKSKADDNAADILALQGLVGSADADGLVKDVAALKAASATHALEESVASRLAGKVDNEAYNTAKAALEAKDTELANSIKETDDKLTAFLTSKDAQDTAVNTLVEIQEYITKHGTEAAGMLEDITENANNIGTLTTDVEALEQALANETKADGNRDAAIKAAIEALDVDNLAVGAGETIKNISETDGKISVEKQAISITKSQVADFNEGDYASSTEFSELKSKAITQDVELIINCGTSTTVLF